MITQDEAQPALDTFTGPWQALEPDGDEGLDYTLVAPAWVTAGAFSVHFEPDRIAIYRHGEENENPIAVIDLGAIT